MNNKFGDNFSSINKLLLKPFNNEKDLINSILKIKENFTTNREKVGEYGLSEKLVSAYTYFYGLTNYYKFEDFIQKTKFLNQIDLNETYEVIDYGCGPGVFSLAINSISSLKIAKTYLVDQSENMLLQAKKLIQKIDLEKNYFYQKDIFSKKLDNKNKKILIFGHFLNEIAIELANRIIKEINPEYILIIEPGTPQSFYKFNEFKESIRSYQYFVNYPCNQGLSCPIETESGNWCHQYFYLNLKETLGYEFESISQKVQLKRNIMPIFYSLISKKIENTNYNSFFICRTYPKNKAFYFFDVCFNLNEKLMYKKIEIQKRSLTKNEKIFFDELLPGSKIKIDFPKLNFETINEDRNFRILAEAIIN